MTVYRSRLADTQLGCKLSEAQGRAKRRLRKAVTGNPDKKVRDYMKEVPQVGRIQRYSPYCLCLMFMVPGEIGGQAVLHIWSHLHSLDRVSGSQISSVLHQLLFGSYDRTSHQQVFLFYVITIDYTRYIVHL